MCRILAIQIRKNIEIKGITMSIENRISQFSDDTIILDGSEQSLSETLGTSQCFSEMSGLFLLLKISYCMDRLLKYSSDILLPFSQLNWGTTRLFTLLGINLVLNYIKFQN
jgi:hypothetical protein